MKRDGVAKKAKDCQPTNKSKDGEIGRSNHPHRASPTKGGGQKFLPPLEEGSQREGALYAHPLFWSSGWKGFREIAQLIFRYKTA